MRRRPKRTDLDLLRVTLAVHSLASLTVVTASVAALVGIRKVLTAVTAMGEVAASTAKAMANA